MSGKLTLLVVNGSVHILPENSSPPGTPCVFLVLLLTSGFILNAFTALSIILSFLRLSFYNILLFHLSCACMFEALVNITTSVVFRASWDELYHKYGNQLITFCRLNSSSMQYTTAVQCSFLSILSWERAILSNINSRPSIDPSPVQIVTLDVLKKFSPFVWLISLVAVIPIMFNVVQSQPYDERYCCSQAAVRADHANAIYSFVFIAVEFYIPWVVTIKSWINITIKLLKEKKRLQHLEIVAQQRAIEGRSPTRSVNGSIGFSHASIYCNMWGRDNHLSGEGFRYFVMAAMLVVCHSVMVIPNIVSVQVSQFQSNYQTVIERQELLSVMARPEHEMPNELHPIITGVYDSAFAWARYSFILVQPLLILFVCVEVRTQCANVICFARGCQKKTLSTSLYNIKQKELKKKYEKQSKWMKSDKFKIADIRTPVLFSTSEGLHLRTVLKNNGFYSLSESEINDVETSNSWNSQRSFACEFCDLQLQVTISNTPPPRARKTLPRLSQTPPPAPVVENDVKFYDENIFDKKPPTKNGKNVRFSKKICEIPLNESGIYSSEDLPQDEESCNGKTIIIKPQNLSQQEHKTTKDLPVEFLSKPNAVSLGPTNHYQLPIRVERRRLSEKSLSQPILQRNQRSKSLELDLIQNSSLNSTANSLILSMSQRFRNRQS